MLVKWLGSVVFLAIGLFTNVLGNLLNVSWTHIITFLDLSDI